MSKPIETMHDLEIEHSDSGPFVYIRQTDTSSQDNPVLHEISVHTDQVPFLVRSLNRHLKHRRKS